MTNVADLQPRLRVNLDSERFMDVGTFEKFVRIDFDNTTFLIGPNDARKLAKVLCECAEVSERDYQ